MPDILLSGLENDLYTAVVLNKIPDSRELYYELYDTETLYFLLAPDHPSLQIVKHYSLRI